MFIYIQRWESLLISWCSFDRRYGYCCSGERIGPWGSCSELSQVLVVFYCLLIMLQSDITYSDLSNCHIISHCRSQCFTTVLLYRLMNCNAYKFQTILYCFFFYYEPLSNVIVLLDCFDICDQKSKNILL